MSVFCPVHKCKLKGYRPYFCPQCIREKELVKSEIRDIMEFVQTYKEGWKYCLLRNPAGEIIWHTTYRDPSMIELVNEHADEVAGFNSK